MNRWWMFGVCAAVLVGPSTMGQETNWSALFDGQTLTGWQQVNMPALKGTKPDSERGQVTFRVENGAIVGRAPEPALGKQLLVAAEQPQERHHRQRRSRRAAGFYLRYIGRRRNAAAIGFINLIYNLARYEQIVRLQLLPLRAV